MVELSRRVIELSAALSDGESLKRVQEHLRCHCAENVPFCENRSPAEMDRIRIAALEVIKGSYAELERAVGLACVDWRDLLV